MYANRLVSHIRSGKKLADKDVIAVLVESSSLKKWQEIVTYKMFYQGLCQRTQELGLKIECFLLKQPGMSTARVDHILYTRGIRGVIMAPPYIGNRSTRINWNRYASIGVGFGREEQDLNRVVFDHLSNYILAYNKLRNMGYRRIGTVLTKRIVHGNHHISQWHIGYLNCQNQIPESERIPVLESTDIGASADEDIAAADRFNKWISEWRVDAVLSIAGSEKLWLDRMNWNIPKEIGLACLSTPQDGNYAGIDERIAQAGAIALESVSSKISHNEFGIPENPTTIMIQGRWHNGPTVKIRNGLNCRRVCN